MAPANVSFFSRLWNILENWSMFRGFVLVIVTPVENQAAKWLTLTMLHPQIGTCTLNSHYWATVGVREKNHTTAFMLQPKPMKFPFQAAEAAFVLLANLCRKRWELVRKSPQCCCVLLRLEEGSVTFSHKALSISVYHKQIVIRK